MRLRPAVPRSPIWRRALPHSLPRPPQPTVLVVNVFGLDSDATTRILLDSARAAGFGARDYRKEYDRWEWTSLRRGEIAAPPEWVPSTLAERWTREATPCSTRAGWDRIACTQALATTLREEDLAMQQPTSILRATVGRQTIDYKRTGPWYVEVQLRAPHDTCVHTFGAGTSSEIRLPYRDAEVPDSEACAYKTVSVFVDRLLHGARAEVTSLGGIGMGVELPECPTRDTGKFYDREKKKKPLRLCRP